mmetsp:Transcript_50765/g.61111  ORF Transcript_50765/g.61111 Transcript_50765/m.61111 type:complete len:413 (-) Transcript_50765:177-1415(-)|eukprot:CAMPEP_0194371316 /NCGR_PEP_ID=MMETSP0174-20130528/19719_1 /TAXON_ID=216777 /ORGANISM="Proboscia alata, Strain PI-D3" /LENGTH=412 /DNA_ID=CAMNT_0039149301 /DNA_START=133 /DNA_END=1371 /DNA_ORIENTATION=-
MQYSNLNSNYRNNSSYLPQEQLKHHTAHTNGLKEIACTDDSQSWHYDLPARLQLHIEILIERFVEVLGGEWGHQIRKPLLILVGFCVLVTLRTARRSNKSVSGYYHSDPYGSYGGSSLRGSSSLSKPTTGSSAYGAYGTGNAYGPGGTSYSNSNSYGTGNSYSNSNTHGGAYDRNTIGGGTSYSNSAGAEYGTANNGAYGTGVTNTGGYQGLQQQQQYNSGYGSAAQTGYGTPLAAAPLATSSYGTSTSTYDASAASNSYGATTQTGYGRSTQGGYSGQQQQYGTAPESTSSLTSSSYGASATNYGSGTGTHPYGTSTGSSAAVPGTYASSSNLYGSTSASSASLDNTNSNSYSSLSSLSSSSYNNNSKGKTSILGRLLLRIKNIIKSFLSRKKKGPTTYGTSSSSAYNLGY